MIPFALRCRRPAFRRVLPFVLLLLSAFVPAAGEAQLRPLDPVDWEAFAADRGVASLGAGYLVGQRASLAGTEGALMELGTFRVAVHLGSTVIQLGGTAFRSFSDQRVVATPLAGARPPDGERRMDVGDQRVSTLIRLTDEKAATQGLVRFGVRLPTTDNRVGLERDQTDFFATLAGRRSWGPLALSLEAGMGVYGTRSQVREQVDPVLYFARLEYDGGLVRPVLSFLGQHDTRPNRDLRGTEDLAEMRLGLLVGGDRRLRLELIRGTESVSPDWGISVAAAATF